MPNNKSGHVDIPLAIFQASLHAYHDLAHLLSDQEADLLLLIIEAYVSRHNVHVNVLKTVKDLIHRVWQES